MKSICSKKSKINIYSKGIYSRIIVIVIYFFAFVSLFSIGFSRTLLGDTTLNHLETRNQKILKKKRIITTEPREIIDLMRGKFKSFDTYTAKFKEFSYGSIRNGEIYYKKPHSLRVNYFNSKDNSIVEIYVDEKKLFVYLKTLNLVAEQDLLIEKEIKEIDEVENRPILNVVNLDTLINTYNFNFLESKLPVNIINEKDANRFRVTLKSEVKGYHFLLTPKDKTRGLSAMELWVSSKGYVLRAKSWTMENRLIDFLFYNIKLNDEILDDVFEFVVPPSAQISKNLFIQFNDSG